MVIWTPELISKFLLMTLQQITPQISRETWNKVADALGDDITAEACRQKYAKLLGASGIEPAAATSSTATPVPATPKSGRKRKDIAGNDATPSKSASAKKQKKAQPISSLKVEEDEAQGEELIVPRTPYKKRAPTDDSD